MDELCAAILLVVITLLIMRFTFSSSGNKNSNSKKDAHRLGIINSNLDDEFSHMSNASSYTVKSLWIYPVKSCHGIELDKSRVVKTGLEYDRMFTFAMLKENATTKNWGWDIVTQRQSPLLATVHVDLEIDSSLPASGVVHVSFPAVNRKWYHFANNTCKFTLPMVQTKEMVSRYKLSPVHIWKERPQALDMSKHGKHVFPQLKAYLGIAKDQKIAIFRMPPMQPRKVYRNAPTAASLGYQSLVAFADSYPLHLMNLASVQDLNSKIKHDISQLSVKRFRANIIMTGPVAYNEDNWKRFTIGTNKYLGVTRCVRCKLPNTDQQTGLKHATEPDRTMRKYRNIDEGSPMNACMGMQCVPESEDGWIHVGDGIEVLETGEHRYLPL